MQPAKTKERRSDVVTAGF